MTANTGRERIMNTQRTRVLILLVAAILGQCLGTCLYNFREEFGDTRFVPGDDTATMIDLTTPFRFYGTDMTTLWMSSNGVVSFDGPFTDYTPNGHITNYGRVIAIMHDDLYNNGHDAFYRQSTDPRDLELSTAFVRKLFPSQSSFTATGAIIMTWDRFRLYSVPAGVNPVLTMQSALISSNTVSVVINLYIAINYNQYLAVFGVHAGDGINFKQLCFSSTPNTVLIDDRAQQSDSTNGLYGFIVEQGENTDCVPSVPGLDVSPVSLGDGTCVFDCDCIDSFATCNGTGQCLCPADRADSNTDSVLGGSCLAKVPNSAACVPGQCTDENAVCDSTSLCVCKSGFKLNDSDVCILDIKASIYCMEDVSNSSIVNVKVIIQRNISFGLQALDVERFTNAVREEPEGAGCKTAISPPYATLSFNVDRNNVTHPGCGVIVTGDVINVTVEAIQYENVYQANDTIYQLSCNIMPRLISHRHNMTDIPKFGPLDRSDRYLRQDIVYVGRDVAASEATLGQYLSVKITYDPGVNSGVADPMGVTPVSCQVGDSPNFSLYRKTIVGGCVVGGTITVFKLSNHFVRTSSPSDRVWTTQSGTFKAGYFLTSNRIYIQCTVRFCSGLHLDECVQSCGTTVGRRKREAVGFREEILQSSIVVHASNKTGECVAMETVTLVISTLGCLIVVSFILTVVMFAYFVRLRERMGPKSRK